MTLDEAYKLIDRYLESDKHSPIIVDLIDATDIQMLKLNYGVGTNTRIVPASQFCVEVDSTPIVSKMKNYIATEECNIFLTGYSSFLKLSGADELRFELQTLLNDTHPKGKLVVLTCNCRSYMTGFDRRLKETNRIILVGDNCEDNLKRLYFVAKNLPLDYSVLSRYADCLSKLPALLEATEDQEIYIRTSVEKKDFPQSLFDIKQISSSFYAIKSLCDKITNIDKSAGSEEEWNEMLSELQKSNNSLSDLIEKNFNSTSALATCFSSFSGYDTFHKWSYFIALKCFGAKENEYLTKVIYNSRNLEEFESELYDAILEIDITDANFASNYDERKRLLSFLPKDNNNLLSFCKKVASSNLDAISYLTNNSKLEREWIVKLIGPYAKENGQKKTLELLKGIYPALYSYLSPYNYGDNFNEYFAHYKYDKVVNEIDEEFINLADEQIEKRDFLSLSTRSYLMDKIDKKNTKLFFMDAMGVEFLSYIQNLCFERGLDFSAQIGRCGLPSITSFNKGFTEGFPDFYNIKKLDELKHEGQFDYDYQKTKEPIHVVEELNILDEIISKADSELQQGNLEKVLLVADHGASRMAVIKESENQLEMAEKGKHSGRCCPKSDFEEKPENCTEDNGYWCLLSYDRFKGSRKACVEVHGGATLEEVLVPIIEITKKNQKIDCYILEDFKTIISSFKKVAKIRLYIGKTLENVSILVDEQYYYNLTRVDGKDYVYEVEMPEVKKAGTHELNVLVNNGIFAKGLSFELKKEGASERKFF